MTLNYLGECCNQVNIQSDGSASVYHDTRMGDYEKFGNDSNIYYNVMGNGQFIFKDPNDGLWMVCTKY